MDVELPGVGFAHLDLAQLENPEHAVTREQLSAITSCPKCGAPTEPEPTDEERAKLFADPDAVWFPPDGVYLRHGFGLNGGGYGPYVQCDCGFFAKHDLGPDAE